MQTRHKRQEFSSEKIFSVRFSGFASSPLKYKKIFELGARKFHFLKYNKLFQSGYFLLFELGKFLKYKINLRLESSISGNMRNFLVLEPESSISWNITIFFRADFRAQLKRAPGIPIYNYFWEYFSFSQINKYQSLNKLCSTYICFEVMEESNFCCLKYRTGLTYLAKVWSRNMVLLGHFLR